MRHFILGMVSSILLLTGAGCSSSMPVDFSTDAQTVGAGFTIGESWTYRDGLTITLKAINDSRCKPDVQCIWQGELSPVFSLSGGELKTTEELTLGTVRQQEGKVEPYTIKLTDAAPDRVTIEVRKGK